MRNLVAKGEGSIESPGLVTPGTALARAADLAGTTECGRTAFTGRCRDSVTYSWPELHTLRKCWRWMPTPDALRGPSLPRIAHHEAGHAVLMQWIGLGCARAVAGDTKGQAFFPDLADKMRDLQEPADATGELAATAAAVFAAGTMAEMIFTGSIWTGPMFRNEQHDSLVAEEMLRPAFGAKSSAGHAWAQRAALHVLQARWAEVQAIAADLIERGEWHATRDR